MPVVRSNAVARGSVGMPFVYSIDGKYQGAVYTAEPLPPGLSLDSYGNIMGTPTSAGIFRVPVTAKSPFDLGSGILTIEIMDTLPLPTIDGNAVANGTVGKQFKYQFGGFHIPGSISAEGLPPGLSFSTDQRNFSGVPTTPGTYKVPIVATNSTGTVHAVLTIHISPSAPQPTPVLSSAAGAEATVGLPFSYAITAANIPTAFAATNLPAGLSLDAKTGVISGTPVTPGTFVIGISASNFSGSVSASLTLKVSSKPLSIPVILSGMRYRAQSRVPFAFRIVAGNAPESFSATSLPAGLTLNPITGEISGTPTMEGIYDVPVSATNAIGTGYAQLRIFIHDRAPRITSAIAVKAVESMPFKYTITANPKASYYSASGLPPGISLNASTGILSGIPTTSGTYPVTVGASDSWGSVDAKVSITVGKTLPQTPLIAGNAAVNAVRQYSFHYSISSGDPSVKFAASGLPGGLKFDSRTGVISGIPSSEGIFNVQLSASNEFGSSAAILKLTVVSYLTNFTETSPNSAGMTGTVGAPLRYKLQRLPGDPKDGSVYSL
ncbi:MAG: putative Ig domain-containing protein, partial [Verrucomicrobiota bacterium]